MHLLRRMTAPPRSEKALWVAIATKAPLACPEHPTILDVPDRCRRRCFTPRASGAPDMRAVVPLVLVLLPTAVSAEDLHHKPSDVKASIDRGLAFLAKDALAWKDEHNCVSCHHAALVVWSLREAKLNGHSV